MPQPYCNLHGPFESNATVACCPHCANDRNVSLRQNAALAEQSKHSDDLQRREYAAAAPPIPDWFKSTSVGGTGLMLEWAWYWAERMLDEQRKREDK